MAIGKNPRKAKGGKKRQKYDAFAKKEWYKIKAPRTFTNRDMGWTPVNKTAGTKISADSLKGRVFEFYLADLKRQGNSAEDYYTQDVQDSERMSSRKMKLKCEEIMNIDCLTNFYGMSMTTDKLRQCISKWTTLVEGHADVRTTDGYLLRVFCIARTTQDKHQVKKTSYAKASQVREIRRKMKSVITDEVSLVTLEGVVTKLIANNISDAIARTCKNTFPIEQVHIRKVKMLKAPPADYTLIRKLHEAGAAEEFVEDPELAGDDAAPDAEAEVNP